MKTLEQQIEDLKAEYSKKEKEVILKNEITDKTGIEDVIIYSNNSIGFFWSVKKATREDIAKILNVFPVSTKETDNHEIRFASGGKNFFSDSPVWLTWQNYDSHYQKEIKIHYVSECGKEIQITVSPSFYPSNYLFYKTRNGKHLGFGRYETFRDMYMDTPFCLQRYSGGSCVYYFQEGAKTHSEYLNYIFTGEFKHEDEI